MKTSKKWGSAALATAMLTASLTTGMARSSAADPVTITFWGAYGNGGNSTQQDALNKILIPAFEAANPGITVNYVDVAYDSLLQKLTTSAAGDQLPDLVRADLGWVPKFADLGVLVPLSDKMNDFKTLASATYKGSLATNFYKGKYYGLPLDTNTRVLISNQKALAAAGRTTPPKTWADLAAMSRKIQGKKISLFADGGLGAWNISPWLWSGGGDLTNPSQTISTGFLNSAKNIATVQMLVNYYKKGLIPNLITGNSGAVGTSDGLPKALDATIFDGPWMSGIWSGQYPNFSPVYSPIPAGPGGSVSVVGGEDVALTASSKNQDAAMKFIRFTQTPQFQMEMVKTGQMTVIPALAAQEIAVSPYYKTFAAQLKTAKSRVSNPNASKIDGILNTNLVPAFLGKTSVKNALTVAAAQIDYVLSSAK